MSSTRTEAEPSLLAELRAGLSAPQKQLPSKLFYDQRGSELFEEITRLPEYYPTRTEHALLGEYMPRWIAEVCPRALVELGAGNAEKTRTILDAMRVEGCAELYVPVDISAEFLEQTATDLRAEYRGLKVVPTAADFTRRIELPASLPHPVLITVLGSTIGNFPRAEAVALLARIAAALDPEDRCLLGMDLRKDVGILEAAYNDSRGVTAEFNRNVLTVLNRDYGANFDVDAFEHRAFYNRDKHRIEMHLLSTRAQRVHIPGIGDFDFRAGESVRTEISCKYDHRSAAGMFADAGLEVVHWAEDAHALFGLVLGRRTRA